MTRINREVAKDAKVAKFFNSSWRSLASLRLGGSIKKGDFLK